MTIQELLLKSFASGPCDTELAEVVKLYSDDLDSFKLKGQLLLIPQTAESMGFDTSEFDVNDLLTFLQCLVSSAAVSAEETMQCLDSSRYPKQVLYFVKVNTNGKLETKQEVLYTTVVI